MTGKADQKKPLVLFVAAEPTDGAAIRLGAEFRDIKEEVRRKAGDRIEFETLWATRPGDLTRALAEYDPMVVHFSGHGTKNGGFLLESHGGISKEIGPDNMRYVFKTYKKQTRLVLLNACYAEKLADAIAESVPGVIGMNDAIDVEAAIYFSVGFYRGLVAGETFKQCLDMGRTEIAVHNLPGREFAVLRSRPSVNPTDLMNQRLIDLEAVERRDLNSRTRVSRAEDIQAGGSIKIQEFDHSEAYRLTAGGDVVITAGTG